MPPRDATNTEALSPTEYELLPPSGPGEQQQSLMGQEEQVQKPEGRNGDLIAMYIAIVSLRMTSICSNLIFVLIGVCLCQCLRHT